MAVSLCPQPSLIEEDRDFCRPVTILDVPLVNLADNRRFFLIDCKVEVVADSFIIPIDNVGDSAFFCVHFLAEFHAFRGVRAFFLRQRTEDCQDKFAVAHTGHIGGQKLRFNPQRFQLADILQKVNRVPGKAGNIFYHDHIKEAMLRIRHHTQKLFPVLDFRPGNALVCVKARKVIPGASGIFGEEFFLRFQAVELIFFVGGNTAVGGDVHSKTSLLKSNRSVTTLFYHVLFGIAIGKGAPRLCRAPLVILFAGTIRHICGSLYGKLYLFLVCFHKDFQ